MDTDAYVAALKVERQSLIERGLPTDDVDAEIARASGVDATDAGPAETTAMPKPRRRRA